MKYEEAKIIAESIKLELEPHCGRCEIAGSVRRRAPEVKDIEVVCIPFAFEYGLLESGIATVVNRWHKVKGEMTPKCKYTQRILPQGIKLDLFLANYWNWGYIYGIRTGSAAYSKNVLARGWVRNGYRGIDGNITYNGEVIPVMEEEDLFRIAGVEYVDPWDRECK